MIEKGFVKDVVEFYDKFLTNISDTLVVLADIQEKYKKQYNELKDIQKDPSKLINLTNEISDEERRILLDLLITVSSFESRLMRLYDLSPKDKKQLAEDIKHFLSKFKGVINE